MLSDDIKRISSDKYKKRYDVCSGAPSNLGINKIPIDRPIFVWGPGLLNMIFQSHKNMNHCMDASSYQLLFEVEIDLFMFYSSHSHTSPYKHVTAAQIQP